MKNEFFTIDGLTIKNCSSPMKIGTDSVLLGQWIEPHLEDKRFLDIGTGTGIILLMVANKVKSLYQSHNLHSHEQQFIGIDIDEASVEEAQFNFDSSEWSAEMRAEHTSLQDFCNKLSPKESLLSEDSKFDLIFSNPPFFVNSLKAPNARRSNARHTDSLPFIQIIEAAFLLLKRGGRLALILPPTESEEFRKEAELYHIGKGLDISLKLSRSESVQTSPTKPPKRCLLEFILVENL